MVEKLKTTLLHLCRATGLISLLAIAAAMLIKNIQPVPWLGKFYEGAIGAFGISLTIILLAWATRQEENARRVINLDGEGDQ